MPEITNTSVLEPPALEQSSLDGTAAITVNHVSMVFNMASEQLNSLKEYAIKLIKRELFFEAFTALDDVSFCVEKGDVFGIVGTNGSGKSTILKIIAGVMEPTKGSCTINGKIAPLIELGAGFDPELSARENIYLNGALLGYSKDFIAQNFDAIVEFAEIESFLDMPLKNYSSGMIARIAFAVATVIVPEVLIVDEVLSVGDFMFQKKCEDRISELITKHNVTVLIVSHSTDQIERLCNKAVWIEKGHVRMLDDAQRVCRAYRALGGRTGSAESERKVYEVLTDETRLPDESVWDKRVFGDSLFDTSAALAIDTWSDSRPETMLLVGGDTHANGIIGCGLAAALGASLATGRTEHMPDSTLGFMYLTQPKKVLVIDRGNASQGAIEELDGLPWAPEIQSVSVAPGASDLSFEALAYGSTHGTWGNTAIIVPFDENPESCAIAPLAAKEACPVIVTDREITGEDATLLAKAGISKAILIGDAADYENTLADLGIEVTKLSGETTEERCFAITSFVFERFATAGPVGLACSVLNLGVWPELSCAGCYAAQNNMALLLEDNRDLDNVASCIDFVKSRSNSISALSFIGGDACLDKSNRELLYRASKQ